MLAKKRTSRWKKVVAPSIFRKLEISEALSSSMNKGIVTIHKDTWEFWYPGLKASYSQMSFY